MTASLASRAGRIHTFATSKCLPRRATAPSPVATPRAYRVVCRAAETEGKVKSVEDMLNEANALLERVSNGQPLGSSYQASIDELSELGYVCDESGCVLVLPGDRQKAVAEVSSINRLLRGNGWSIGKVQEPEDEDYPAVVSGPFWTIPMKPKELEDFLEVLNQLRRVVQQLESQGQWLPGSAERPVSRVKWESTHITLQATFAADEPAFSMEMTFRTEKRSVITHWPSQVVAEVVVALDQEFGKSTRAKPTAKAAVSA